MNNDTKKPDTGVPLKRLVMPAGVREALRHAELIRDKYAYCGGTEHMSSDEDACLILADFLESHNDKPSGRAAEDGGVK